MNGIKLPEKDFFFGIIATLAPKRLEALLLGHYDKKYGIGGRPNDKEVVTVSASMAAELTAYSFHSCKL